MDSHAPSLAGLSVTQLVVTSRFCSQCSAELLVGDNFCARCGRATSTSHPGTALAVSGNQPPVVQPSGMLAVRELLDNRLFVVAVILFIGPLGLPALWFSRSFSRTTKIVTTVCYFLFTVVLPLAVAWYWLDVAVRPLLDAFAQINGR